MSKIESLSEDALVSEVINVVKDVVKDWDIELEEEINGDTGLIEELEFESIDIVRFVVALEQHFECRGIPFEKLFMNSGGYISELKIIEVAQFLSSQTTK